MNRPVGVIIIAVLQFISSFFGAIAGLLLIFFSRPAINWLSQTREFQEALQDVPIEIVFNGAIALGAVVLLFSILGVLIGWGLLQLKAWAWVLTLVFQSLGAASNLIAFFTQFNPGVILQLAISAIILYYLLQPDVRRAFGL